MLHAIRLIRNITLNHSYTFHQRFKGKNAYPMFFVNVFISIPFSGKEGVFFTDYFTIEEGDHFRILIRQVLYLQVAAQVSILLINVLQ